MRDDSGVFSREEVLAGLPARRARTLVYLIERAAARLRLDREVATMALVGERSAEARELAWIEAFALDEEPSSPLTPQDIEAAAGGWTSLVPRSAEIRAATARLLSERYPLDRRRMGGLRAALGLDSGELAAAFERQTGRPLDSIWSRTGPLERLRWLASSPGRWLERTTAFRAAAALTFLTCLGQSVLIVPISVATVGVLAAVASILVIGLFALSATAAVAEATTRNGVVRFRGGFFGRLATSSLGAAAGTVPGLLGLVGIALRSLSAFIGLALLLSLITPIPAELWVGVPAAATIAVPLVWRRTASFGGLMTFGLVNVALLAVLSALVLISATTSGGLATPSLTPPGDIGIEVALGVIIGVLLTTYADPVYTVQIGRVVLPNDPDGTGYVRGSVLGMAVFVAVTLVFSAVLLLVLPAGELAGESGSALDAISDDFGPAAIILATLIGVGLFGLVLYGNAIALFDFVAERMPGRSARRVFLRAGGERVLLSGSDGHRTNISLAYRGIREDRPLIAVSTHFEDGEAARALPSAGESTTIAVDGESLEVEVLAADEGTLRLAIATDLTISYDGDPLAAGPGVAETLLGEGEASRLSAWLLREGGGTAKAAAQHFRWSQREAREHLEKLVVDGGAVVEDGERFVLRMAARRRRSGLPDEVWSRLGLAQPGDSTGRASDPAVGIVTRRLASPAARMVLCSLPTASLAVLSAALIAAGSASVTAPYRIGGVIVVTTISGVLPPMLLLAARRRSDVAGGGGGGILVGRVLMVPMAAGAVAVLILHATILWTNPIERVAAAAAAAVAFASMVLALRHGSFRPAALVELRQSREGGPVRVLAEESGRPLGTEASPMVERGDATEFTLDQASDGIIIRGHTARAEELRISALLVEPSGVATALPLKAQPEEGLVSKAAGAEEPGPVHLEERGGTASWPVRKDWALVLRSEKPLGSRAGGGSLHLE
jgi:hypothetical protein